jgi:UDP-2,3-diacylglucosamine hydrolase
MQHDYLFFSDCHLDQSRPDISKNLLEFLSGLKVGNLYILGDLFEVWLGDDDPASALKDVVSCLKRLSSSTRIYFLAGNRDFLVGKSLANRAGFEILHEPARLTLGNQQVLLLHGDVLCTDDHDYQSFRQRVRNPDWQSDFLAKPLNERKQIATDIRANSRAAMQDKPLEIMDVNAQTVDSFFNRHSVEVMIHGHTHRPAIHHHSDSSTRYVLGDWNPQPSYLSWSKGTGFELHDLRVSQGR